MGVFYAGVFLGVGVMMTFMPLHLRLLGMTASMTGALFAMRTLVQTLLPPFLGIWADRMGSARTPLIIACAGSALSFVPLLWVTDLRAVTVLLLMQSAFGGALVPLADSMTLTLLGVRPQLYGRIRLAGSVAFGVGILVFSSAVSGAGHGESMDDAVQWAVPAIGGAMVLCVLLAFALPHVSRQRASGARAALGALKSRNLWVLFAAGAVHWAAHAPYTVFFGVHLKDLGLAPHWAALSLAGGIVVETWVMFRASAFLPALNTRNALLFTLAVGLLRWVITALAHDGWLIVLAQATHGISFGLFYVLLVAVVREEVPEEARSTGQTVMTGVVFGLGGVGGTLLAGAAFDVGKGPLAFACSAGLEVLAMLMTLGFKRSR